VSVSGQVTEFKGQTQLDRVTTLRVLETAELPAPEEVRLPLTSETDAERYEGMLVTFPQTLTVSGNYGLANFGELVLSSDGRLFNPTNGQGGDEKLNARRRLVLDDGSTRRSPRPVPYVEGTGTRRAGDTVQDSPASSVTASMPIACSPQSHRALLRPIPVWRSRRRGRRHQSRFVQCPQLFTTFVSQDPKARGAKNAAEFARQSARVVAALHRMDADIVGLIEMENNGAKAMGDLLQKLNATYGKRIRGRCRSGAGCGNRCH
jgi:predicted extracellular nuclease